MKPKQLIVQGLVAGVIGATILAVWFLVIDTIEGRPFYTLVFLADILAQVDEAGPSVVFIALYTVFHYGAFCLVGIAVAWLMSKFRVFPPLLSGLVLGFVLFDLVFYQSVLLTGVDVVERLGWPSVLFGNLLSGVGLMGYLHVKSETPSALWLVALSQHRIVREGVIAGALGAVAVAVWFLIFDLVRGQVFFTPGALGSAVFLRIADSTAVQISLLTVGGYTVVHFAAFIVIGLVAAAIACQAEKVPPLLLAGLLIFATFEAFFLGTLAVLAEWLLGALGWVSVGLGNLLATVVMAYYLLWAHPKLRAVLSQTTLAGEDVQISAPESHHHS